MTTMLKKKMMMTMTTGWSVTKVEWWQKRR